MDLLLSILLIVAKSLALLLIGLTAVAYYIYADRKIWASVQLRRGPNVVGAWGLLQSFADLLKFVFKEPMVRPELIFENDVLNFCNIKDRSE